MLNGLPKNEEGILFGFLADIEPDPYAGFRLVFTNGTTSKGAAVAVLVASRKKKQQARTARRRLQSLRARSERRRQS